MLPIRWAMCGQVNDKVIKPLQEFHTLAELQLKALVYDEQKVHAHPDSTLNSHSHSVRKHMPPRER